MAEPQFSWQKPPDAPEETPLPLLETTGNGDDAAEAPELDEAEKRYATDDRQEALRKFISNKNLPVKEKLEELVQAIIDCYQRKGILLFQGETGSGKSIYSPIAVREALMRLDLLDQTVMMQPRRDAARGIARATAALQRATLGDEVGFSTSEFKELNPQTEVKIVTPGIFLRYLIEGRIHKDKVGAIIIDELHENSIEYHLCLALIKKMQQEGTAPIIILTSATLNKEEIQKYFGIDDQDYIKIEGRSYPIDIIHKQEGAPLRDEQGKELNYMQETALKVKELCKTDTDGDILVFMPGAREIDNTIRLIGNMPGVEVLALHGAQTPDERDHALSEEYPRGVRRRIIVATNIAETSLTLPNIKIVIDSCRQRSVRFNPKTGIIEKGTEFIARDQAEQRAGRAGRVAPGKCFRMITKREFTELPQRPDPEIKRTNLAKLVLQLKFFRLEPLDVDFIVPPDPRAIEDAEWELQQLDALDESKNITELGRQMMALPFEPNLARMVIEAKKRNCMEASLVLASFERESNVILGPSRKDIEDTPGIDDREKKKFARMRVQRIQQQFERGGSDILKSLNVFKAAIEYGVFEVMHTKNLDKRQKSPEQLAQEENFYAWCKKNYLKAEALTHIAYRLKDYATYAGVRLDYDRLYEQLESVSDEELSCTILAGHVANLLYLTKEPFRGMAEYQKITLRRASIETINLSPGSDAFSTNPRICLAGQISEGQGTNRGVEITRNYASHVHPVSLQQIKVVMPHLLAEKVMGTAYNITTDTVESTVSYSVRTTGMALGEEKQPITGALAVRTFAEALAANQVDMMLPEKNYSIMSNLTKLYHRSGGVIGSPADIVDWYISRLGAVSTRREAVKILDRLMMDETDFVAPKQIADLDRYYPETITVQEQRLLVEYNFKPATPPSMYYPGSPAKREATLMIPEKLVWQISEKDIPAIGRLGDNLELKFKTQVSYLIHTANSLAQLKAILEKQLLDKAWRDWSDKPQPEEIKVGAGKRLGEPEIYGKHPIPFATDSTGTTIYAYPGINYTNRFNPATSGYDRIFVVEYYRTVEDAKRATEATRQVREQTNLYAEKPAPELADDDSEEEDDWEDEEDEEIVAPPPISHPESAKPETTMSNQEFMAATLRSFPMADALSLVRRMSPRVDTPDEYPYTPSDEGQATLGEHLKAKEQESKERPLPKPEPKAPLPPKPEQPKEMTPEAREKMLAELLMAETFIRDVLAVPRPTIPKAVSSDTRTLINISKTLDAASDANKRLKEIRAKISTTDNAASAQGFINEIARKADRLAADMARHQNTSENWPSLYRTMLEIYIPEFEQTYGVEKLTPAQIETIKPKLIALAKQRRPENLKDKVEEIFVEVVA